MFGKKKEDEEFKPYEPQIETPSSVPETAEVVEEHPFEEKEQPIDKEKEALQKRINELEGKKEVWGVREVATQTTPIIYNAQTKKSYNLFEALVELLNRIE